MVEEAPTLKNIYNKTPNPRLCRLKLLTILKVNELSLSLQAL
jgi:hypothetical protein